MSKRAIVVTDQTTKEQGYFRAHDGQKLFYSVRGPKNAPPLLFVYGLVCSQLQWKYQMDHFEKTHRVIYMDFRGHNHSEVPEALSTMTIQNLARDLLSLLEELDLPPLPVLGHSLGVNVVLELYRMCSERISALVLANGTPKNPFETMFHHNFLHVLFPAVPKLYSLFPEVVDKFWKSQGQLSLGVDLVAKLGFNTKYAKREDIKTYLLNCATVRTDVFLHLLQDFVHYDSCHWLEEVKAPTLIIGGERDMVTPISNQRIMQKLIPNSELVMIEECAHCPQLEKVEEVNQVIAAFLKKVESKKLKVSAIKRHAALKRA